MLSAIEEALVDTGLHVTIAPDVPQAIVQIRNFKPVLIISDKEFGAEGSGSCPFLLVGRTIDLAELKAKAVELSKPPVPVVAPAPVAAPVPVAPPPPPKRWLLILGNDSSTPTIVEMALMGMDVDVSNADSVEQAAVQAQSLKPELILCDLDLPGFASGVEALKRLRMNPDMSAVPFLLISGRAEDKALEHLLAADTTAAFMNKPLDLDKIKTMIEHLLTGEPIEAPLPAPAISTGVKRGLAVVLNVDPLLRGTLDGVLTALGFEISTGDAAHALSQAYESKPSLIVSNLHAPGAVELLTEMRMDTLLMGIPFLFIGEMPVEQAMGLLPWGDTTVRFVKTPFELDKLKLHVLELLGEKGEGTL
ncbi:MAG: response regulator [Elusimicrobiota bacterium]